MQNPLNTSISQFPGLHQELIKLSKRVASLEVSLSTCEDGLKDEILIRQSSDKRFVLLNDSNLKNIKSLNEKIDIIQQQQQKPTKQEDHLCIDVAISNDNAIPICMQENIRIDELRADILKSKDEFEEKISNLLAILNELKSVMPSEVHLLNSNKLTAEVQNMANELQLIKSDVDNIKDNNKSFLERLNDVKINLPSM